MSLASLVDKPLIQNPLAGGAMTSPQESQLQGDALVQQMQMRMQQRDQKTPAFMAYFGDVMDTKGYPTKTMQEYQNQFPETTPQQVPLGANMFMGNATLPNLPLSLLKLNPIKGGAVNPMDEFQRGYLESEFYSPRSTTDVQKFKYKGKDMEGSGTYVSGFEKYLESIGQGNLFERPPNELAFAQGSGPLATMGGQTPPPGLGTPMNPFMGQIDTPEQLIESGQFKPNPMQTGDQGLMDRLTSLEQGIGSLQNQIASLFQTQQASDPFGLGGFINQRRF